MSQDQRKWANHVMSGGGAGRGNCNYKGPAAGLGLWCVSNGEAADVAREKEAMRTEGGREVSGATGPGHTGP